jgi:hypothetical protein
MTARLPGVMVALKPSDETFGMVETSLSIKKQINENLHFYMHLSLSILVELRSAHTDHSPYYYSQKTIETLEAESFRLTVLQFSKVATK